jgi:hypothetical protein
VVELLWCRLVISVRQGSLALSDNFRQSPVDYSYLWRLGVVICDLGYISHMICIVRKSDLRVWRP